MNKNNANFTPAAPNFKTLVRMSFQGLTNFPYIEEDFDALTNYGLLSKVVEYLNEVISNNNEQNTLMTNLYNAYVSLQNYVNDYFNNLDVQDEINNKLDDMAQDGSLTALIKNYLDPYIAEQNIKIGNVENLVETLASGSPKGVYATTAALISANPETGVYIVTADGHIYSWTHGGDTPVDLGVYQATGITDGAVTQPKTSFIPNDTTNKQHNILNEMTPQYLGYCYRQSGDKVNGAYPTYTYDKDDFEELFDFENNYFYINGYSSVTFWDSNNIYISGVGQTLNTSYFKIYTKDDIPAEYDHAIISIISTNLTDYRLYKIPYDLINVRQFYSNTDLAGFTEQYNINNDTHVGNNNIISLVGNKLVINSIPTNRLKNTKINPNSNLLEEDKVIISNTIYQGENHQYFHYDGGSQYMFTSDELDTDNYSYRIDTNYNAYFYNSNKEQIGYETGSSLNLVNWKTLTFPDNWAYLVLSMPYYVNEGKKGVFGKTTTTKHGDITKYDAPEIIPDTSSLKVATSNLNNKKGIFFGDSWCAGNSSYTGGWCRYLNEIINTFTPQNCGRNGADWSQGYTYWFDGTHGDIINKEYDYVIIEAYTNGLYPDESELTKQLGTIDEYTFYDDLTEMRTALGNTYAFDLERFIFTIVNQYEGTKIGLMFPYKSVAMMNENNAFRKFREQVIKCANKYNIPIFDNFNGCNIPERTQTQIDEYFFHQPGEEHGDGVHLNYKGYKLIGNPILEWLERL